MAGRFLGIAHRRLECQRTALQFVRPEAARDAHQRVRQAFGQWPIANPHGPRKVLRHIALARRELLQKTDVEALVAEYAAQAKCAVESANVHRNRPRGGRGHRRQPGHG